jgi:hypothetical protein
MDTNGQFFWDFLHTHGTILARIARVDSDYFPPGACSLGSKNLEEHAPRNELRIPVWRGIERGMPIAARTEPPHNSGLN